MSLGLLFRRFAHIFGMVAALGQFVSSFVLSSLSSVRLSLLSLFCSVRLSLPLFYHCFALFIRFVLSLFCLDPNVKLFVTKIKPFLLIEGSPARKVEKVRK